MPSDELLKEAERQMVICNACRYCEGYCAVFPAMELRRSFSGRDLTYLANLCFDCRDCYYACQYAPPHEFAINIPKILAGLRMDEATIAAALLHDVVEDTDTDIKEVRDEFGDEIAQLVEGVTKLTRIQFQSREQAEAENYRKMVVAMAEDVRVILVKLADRLHNLRTIEYLGKQKQIQKSKEALEVYAPLAHRLGIHALKWELEDLAFQTLHPRKYSEIKTMVAERRADREGHVAEAADVLFLSGDEVGQYEGQQVDATTVIIKYTYTGDANLDGLIDAVDYGVIDNSIQFPGSSGYFNGDFNYDGVIDAADYGYIDNNIQVQGPPL